LTHGTELKNAAAHEYLECGILEYKEWMLGTRELERNEKEYE
jgi:hypothetical protein